MRQTFFYIPLCRDGVAKLRTTPSFHRCKTAVERPEFAKRRLALKTAVKRSLSPLSPALKQR